MLGLKINCSPACLLLSYDSGQNFNYPPLWLSACTVAKKMLAVRRQSLHTLPIQQWNYLLIEILSVELLLEWGRPRKEALNLAMKMV